MSDLMSLNIKSEVEIDIKHEPIESANSEYESNCSSLENQCQVDSSGTEKIVPFCPEVASLKRKNGANENLMATEDQKVKIGLQVFKVKIEDVDHHSNLKADVDDLDFNLDKKLKRSLQELKYPEVLIRRLKKPRMTLEQVEKKWQNFLENYYKNRRTTGKGFMKKPESFDDVDSLMGESQCIRPQYCSSVGLSSKLSQSETVLEPSCTKEVEIPCKQALTSITIHPDVSRRKDKRIRPSTRSESNEGPIKLIVEENKKSVYLDEKRLKLHENYVLSRESNEKEKLEVLKETNKEKLEDFIKKPRMTLEQVERKWQNFLENYYKNRRTTGKGFMKKPESFDDVDSLMGESQCIRPQNCSSVGLSSKLSQSETVLEPSYNKEVEIPCKQARTSITIHPDVSRRKDKRIRPSTRSESNEGAIKLIVEENKKSVYLNEKRLKLHKNYVSSRESNEKEKLEVLKETNKEKLAAYRERTEMMQKQNNLLEQQAQILQSLTSKTEAIEKILEKNFGPIN